MGCNMFEEDDDYVDYSRIKNTIKFLKDQIIEIEKVVEVKSKNYFDNIFKLKEFNKKLDRKKEELSCYQKMFPNYEYLKEHREEIGLYDEMEELKENINLLENQTTILNKTIELQKINIDLEIQKIVRLNIDLSWIKRD